MFKFILISILSIVLYSCTKEVPPEMQSSKQKTLDQQKMPDDSIHRRLMPNDQFHSENQSGNENQNMGDEKVLKYTSEADESDLQYQKSKSEKDKKECINKQLKAANYLMFEADLPSKEKYKPALMRYRRVIELDPKNEEALANKQQIEDIYRSLGKPIPN